MLNAKSLNNTVMKRILKHTSVALLLFGLLCCKEDKNKADIQTNEETAEIAHNWSDDDKTLFSNNCLKYFNDIDKEKSEEYCDCLLKSTMQAESEPSKAMAIEQKDLAGLFLRSECLDGLEAERGKSPWDEGLESEFKGSCVKSQMKQGKSEDEANSFCDCALTKVKAMVPHPQHFMAYTEKEMQQLTEGCAN